MSPVRRVRRVIRRIDPWTVLKVSLVFNAIMALAFVLGWVIFWSIVENAGIPDRLMEFAEDLTLSFEVDGDLYFRIVLYMSVVFAILMTGLATLGAVFYNLISDTVGGIEVVVLEEVIAPMAARSGTTAVRPARRPPRARPTVDKQPKSPPPQASQPADKTAAPAPPRAQPAPKPVKGAAPAAADKAAEVPTAETPVAP